MSAKVYDLFSNVIKADSVLLVYREDRPFVRVGRVADQQPLVFQSYAKVHQSEETGLPDIDFKTFVMDSTEPEDFITVEGEIESGGQVICLQGEEENVYREVERYYRNEKDALFRKAITALGLMALQVKEVFDDHTSAEGDDGGSETV